MTWLLIIGAAWLAVSVVVALVIARAIRLADEKQRQSLGAPFMPRQDDHDVPLAPTPPESSAPLPRPAPDDAPKRARGRRGR